MHGNPEAVAASDPYVRSKCRDCGYCNFPATAICPGCMSMSVEKVRLTMNGTLYSYSSITVDGAKAFVGYVDLPEGVRVFGRIADLETNVAPACGMEVSLRETQAPGNGPQFIFSRAGKVK